MIKKGLIVMCVIGCSTALASGLLPTKCENNSYSEDEKILTYSNGVKIDTMSFEDNLKMTTLDKALQNFVSLDLKNKQYTMRAGQNLDTKKIEFSEIYENKNLNILGTNCKVNACYLSSAKYSIDKKDFISFDKDKCYNNLKNKAIYVAYQTGKEFKMGLIVFMYNGKKIEISASKDKNFDAPTPETGLYFSQNVKINNIEQVLKKPFVLKGAKNKTYNIKTQKQFSDLITKNAKEF